MAGSPLAGPRPRIVEWYRADPGPRMRLVLLAGPGVLTSGGLVIALSFLTHVRQHVRMEAAFAGLVLVAGGAVFATVGMYRLLRDDAYIAIRTDGVAVRIDFAETFVPWDSLVRARWDALRAELVLERDGVQDLAVARTFARVNGADLAERIEHARRKAALGFLK